ncbi:Inner centromere protein-related protein pic1 [Fusarium austroafricanum]|uniref:Inner centromere protein-related protein pic1 n=1 Tax=Fusarium austroafricanum TaxID=2364996 RepID=A0A8H4JR27_9HYPO|nr:Inner centromere protein-related protein pic1 [Fusarium austroafricanum]
MRGPRIPTGSAAWVTDERASALQIVDVEVDEFTYAAHNEFSWLNEHMASIFSENETNIAETFKTPGKLRGKTPRTTRKLITTEPRVPLSNVFGGTPSSSANRFAQHLLAQSPQRELFSQAKSSSPRRHAPSPKPTRPIPDESIEDRPEQTTNDVEAIHSDHDVPMTVEEDNEAAQTVKPQTVTQGDSGYFGSQDVNPPSFDPLAEDPTSPIDSIAMDEAIAFPQLSPSRASPAKQLTRSSSPIKTQQVTADVNMEEAEAKPQEKQIASTDDAQSQSDRHSPSPIRPGFRNSLQFPSLPAREPLTAGKSIGARASRTSHVDPKRTSYLGRHTRGKSLASHAEQDASDESDQDEMDVDDFPTVPQKSKHAEDLALHHNKTYTQMLQDRISVLGKSQPNGSRPSKSIHSLTNSQQPQTLSQPAPEPKSSSPRKQETTTTPGAFPEDDDEDWIVAPSTQQPVSAPTPTRPSLSKSRTADVMEGIHGKQTLGSFDSDEDRANLRSPAHANMTPKRPAYLGHAKSVSVPAVPLVAASDPEEGSPLKKTVSGTSASSRPATAVASSSSPSKSPTRLFRDSPLKHLKNKMSSILTTSKGLIASSAALSAEGKSSLLSPSRVQLGLLPDPSSESIAPKASMDSHSGGIVTDQQSTVSRPVAKRTRASVEREKEEKRREKEARVQSEQMEKLEKEREKEREKARVFSKEQEKLASMEKQVAARKEVETPAPKAAPKPTRTSPRRAKPQEESETRAPDQDADMGDRPALAPPPSVSRSAAPGQLSRPKEMRRIAKPGREPVAKTKATPTVHIKVNTGSQLHPGNSMTNGYQDFGASTSSQPPQTVSKTSKSSTQPKSSASNFGASTGSNGRPKALDLAAQKKAQDERRRDAKAKVERDRTAQKEEKRKQEYLRRQEEDRQKRQALIEKAKKTPAPPPAVRSQPNGPPEYSLQQDKPSVQRPDGPPRPPSRMNSGIYRSQDDMGRPVNASLANGSKSGSKRPLGRDGNEDGSVRPPPSRGPQYQAKDAKRRRTSDDFADELDMEQPPNIKGPPVRPSSALKRVSTQSVSGMLSKINKYQDLQAKTLTNGYVSQASAHNLFKTGVAQSQIKGGNPMDMAQIHKGPIPFAPNPNPAGPSYKTPGRPGPVNGMKSAAKSVPRSSPRFQNGEAIELPEIQTDDEDEDDDEPQAGTVAVWANSPYIRQALVDQELLDPALIFGPPAPLDMDKVFDKSDRRHKFRDRTSSANWSGLDRLTEEDIRKDLAARDKLRREGGWSYELSKDMN